MGNLDLDAFLAAMKTLHTLDAFAGPLGDPKPAIDFYEKAGKAAGLFAMEPITQAAIDTFNSVGPSATSWAISSRLPAPSTRPAAEVAATGAKAGRGSDSRHSWPTRGRPSRPSPFESPRGARDIAGSCSCCGSRRPSARSGASFAAGGITPIDVDEDPNGPRLESEVAYEVLGAGEPVAPAERLVVVIDGGAGAAADPAFQAAVHAARRRP